MRRIYYVARVNAFAEAASQERIVARCALYFEELAQMVWHPSRVWIWRICRATLTF